MQTAGLSSLPIRVKCRGLMEDPPAPPTSSKSPCWQVSHVWCIPGSCTLGPGSDNALGIGRRNGCGHSVDSLRT